MPEDITVFDVMRMVYLWTSPVVLVLSSVVLLLSTHRYHRVEVALGKSIGGIKQKTIPALEKDIDGLQKMMLDNKNLTALMLMLSSLIIIFVLTRM